MLNFTVGPVMSGEEVLKISGKSAPYFRTPEFSRLMLENEQLMLEFLHAPADSRCVFLTTSGTGAMESAVMNILNDKDRVLVANGGSFGQRFADLCRLHRREMSEIRLEFGHTLTKEQLEEYAGKGYTAFLVNMHETSSGVLYDMPMIANFCKANGILLIVDAISAFLADELDMEALGAACVLTGSQKALAVHPGISVMALSPAAIARAEENPEVCMYLSLKEALKNGVRGQTPYTPAVAVLLQIHQRLTEIKAAGGAAAEQAKVAAIAAGFREAIREYPFVMAADRPSNAVTALRMPQGGAKKLIEIMKDEYQIWLCPNGGAIADEIFRVGHIGSITDEDMQTLMKAFEDLRARKLL